MTSPYRYCQVQHYTQSICALLDRCFQHNRTVILKQRDYNATDHHRPTVVSSSYFPCIFGIPFHPWLGVGTYRILQLFYECNSTSNMKVLLAFGFNHNHRDAPETRFPPYRLLFRGDSCWNTGQCTMSLIIEHTNGWYGFDSMDKPLHTF